MPQFPWNRPIGQWQAHFKFDVSNADSAGVSCMFFLNKIQYIFTSGRDKGLSELGPYPGSDSEEPTENFGYWPSLGDGQSLQGW